MLKIINTDTEWVKCIDEDLNTLTQDQLFEVMDMVLENTLVIFRNQNLTPEAESRICSSYGHLQVVMDNTRDRQGQRTEHIAVNEHILRVTGEKNDKGEPGLFGHTSALDWHANQASNYDRKPIVWLYGVKGTKGSRTSWINNIDSYNDLTDDLKEEIADVEITLGYKSGSYSTSKFFVEHHATDKPFKLVHTNDAGKVGLYFPFLQVFGMVGKTQTEFDHIRDRLIEHVLQDKYRYDHDWQDGDVVLSEQWLGIHKRWEYPDMENRLLHRITFDYKKYLEYKNAHSV